MSQANEHSYSTHPAMLHPRHVEVIGVPLDLGQSERGTDVGPTAIRYAGLVERLRAEGHEVTDTGNLPVPVASGVEPERRGEVIAQVNEQLYMRCCRAQDAGRLPLVLGGDHSVAVGSVAASTRRASTGLLWVDAHGDFNTPESSPSGNIHGMPLAALLGLGLPSLTRIGEHPPLAAENVVLLGVRQLDPGERRALLRAKIRVLSMRDIDKQGISRVVAEALDSLSHTEQLHVSFDLDAIDPSEAPGVGTPVRGGLTYREAHLLLEEVAGTGRLAAMDVVELNPMLDVRNKTAQTAVDLVLSALGQRIL